MYRVIESPGYLIDPIKRETIEYAKFRTIEFTQRVFVLLREQLALNLADASCACYIDNAH